MIREKKVRNKSWYVVIDIIRETNPKAKPSKIWSEYKKKKTPPFKTQTFKFESSNGRVYELECVSDKKLVTDVFAPKKETAKVTTTKTTGYLRVEPTESKTTCFKALISSLRHLADQLESL